jgi:2-dehydropantoate 2-reductase
MSETSHWIVGPGALGRLLAMHLAGTTPLCLAGRRRLPARQMLITPDGEMLRRQLPTTTLEALPEGQPAMVHLTTKAYATPSAYAAVAERLSPDTPLVLWQNGFDVQPLLTSRHPGPVLCATTTEGAYVAGDDRVVHAGHGETLVGALDGAHASTAGALASRLTAAGLRCRAVDDIRLRLWQKLAVNAAINPLAARFGIRNGQLRDRPFRPMVEAALDELAPLLTAEGITPPEGKGREGWGRLVWRVVDATATNRASMLQDVLAGRPTEHAAILGPLLAAARRHGLPAEQIRRQYRYLEDRGTP